MDFILFDEEKIKLFSKIQEDLICLEPNSGNEAIESIINLIPKNYLDQKDDLAVICSIFAYYGRNNVKVKIGNTIKLFEKIMEPVKKHFQNDSTFIWNIFGSIFYLKRWMHEEGLISIEYIIQQALFDKEHTIAKYFLPEIYEKNREVFEKEFKNFFPTENSEEYLNEFKELRNKHFKWLRESNDFNDPFYQEIEKNSLRLSIKMDDINRFQSIISNSNIPLNSKIQESLLENTYFKPHPISLIDFAIDFNAVKIVKYLLMNGAKIKKQSVFNSICNRNYEIIHMIESMNEKKFEKNCMIDSIQCWNLELIKYSIENYNYEYLENENVESDKYEIIYSIIYSTSYSVDFQFFELILLPFLKKNPKFFKDKFYQILGQSFVDNSCFFLKGFLKYPEKIDINFLYSQDDKDDTLLTIAIKSSNVKAIDILLNDPNIDIEKQGKYNMLPFHLAIIVNSEMSVLDMFLNHPKFDINAEDKNFSLTPFGTSIIKRNFYTIEHIMKKLPDYFEEITYQYLFICMDTNNLLCAKFLLKSIMNQNKDKDGQNTIEELKSYIEYKYKYDKILSNILHELKTS